MQRKNDRRETKEKRAKEIKMFKSTEIRSQTGTLHFRRWRLIETTYFRFYVHEIFESDMDLHLHSHPWHFVSFLIKGKYFEKVSDGSYKNINRFNFNFHKASDYHKLTLLEKPTVSLFLAFGKYRPWGYKTETGHIDSEEYRELKRKGKLPEE